MKYYELGYKRLANIVKNVPPYRGNVNRFPILQRRENTKFFLRREEDEETVFDIVYGYRHTSTDLSKEEYERLFAEGYKDLHTYPVIDSQGNTTPDAFTYKRYEQVYNIMGTVRSDNTFEFTKEYYGTGEYGFLSTLCNGWFYNDSRRGGLIYKVGTKMHPIWKGMKMQMETMNPNEPYEVVIHHVDRKKAKELLSKYEHFYKVSEVMLKSMTTDMVLDMAVEILESIWGKDKTKVHTIMKEEFFAEAEKRVYDAPLDAFALYCMALNVERMTYQLQWNQGKNGGDAYSEYFIPLKNVLNKHLYKQHRDIFKEVKYQIGEAYPSCQWGTKILVDGKEVTQV